jgi:hypothetical protein
LTSRGAELAHSATTGGGSGRSPAVGEAEDAIFRCADLRALHRAIEQRPFRPARRGPASPAAANEEAGAEHIHADGVLVEQRTDFADLLHRLHGVVLAIDIADFGPRDGTLST